MLESLSEILDKLCVLPPDGRGALEVLSAYATERDSLRTDALGSVIWTRAGSAAVPDHPAPAGHPSKGGELTHLMLEAHLDTIAMVVTAVLPEGFLRVQPVGGVDRRPLPGTAVTVWGREKIPGVIASTPPHLKEKDAPEVPEWADILIDVGSVCRGEHCSSAEVTDNPPPADTISPGDLISFDAPPAALLNGTVTAAGLDNRAGCAAVLLALLLTKDCPRPLTAVFAVREETNGAGAMTAAYAIYAALERGSEAFDPINVSARSVGGGIPAIAVDVSYAQAPDVTAEEGGKLGGGVMLGISPVLDGAVTERLRELARENNIPLQAEAMGSRTGTDADKIQTVRTGIPTGLLSIPLRNMHTACEAVSLTDIENAAKLLAAAIASGELRVEI